MVAWLVLDQDMVKNLKGQQSSVCWQCLIDIFFSSVNKIKLRTLLNSLPICFLVYVLTLKYRALIIFTCLG
jgi:hypothetical protein